MVFLAGHMLEYPFIYVLDPDAEEARMQRQLCNVQVELFQLVLSTAELVAGLVGLSRMLTRFSVRNTPCSRAALSLPRQEPGANTSTC